MRKEKYNKKYLFTMENTMWDALQRTSKELKVPMSKTIRIALNQYFIFDTNETMDTLLEDCPNRSYAEYEKSLLPLIDDPIYMDEDAIFEEPIVDDAIFLDDPNSCHEYDEIPPMPKEPDIKKLPEPKKLKSHNEGRILKHCKACKWIGYLTKFQISCPVSGCAGSVTVTDVEAKYKEDMDLWKDNEKLLKEKLEYEEKYKQSIIYEKDLKIWKDIKDLQERLSRRDM